MRRLNKLVWIPLLLIAVSVLTVDIQANAQQTPEVSLISQYTVGRYGYGVINETLSFHNNSTSQLSIPNFSLGFTQEIANLVSYYNYTFGYHVTQSTNSSIYQVNSSGQVVKPGSVSTFSLQLFLPKIVKTTNSSIYIYLMLSPSINISLSSSKFVIRMPSYTQLKNVPPGFGYTTTGSNTTYFRTDKNIQHLDAKSLVAQIQTSNQMDFHPLTVYKASRKLSFSSSGQIMVTDTITFRNDGVTTLSTLTVSPLTKRNTKIIVVASSQPPLLNPVTVSLSGYGIPLSASGLNSPVQSNTNYTISYTYQLDPSYYTASGGIVTLKLPLYPPIPAVVEKYTISVQTQPGVRVLAGQTLEEDNVNIFSTGTVEYKLQVTVAWSSDYFVPLASLVFFVLLFGFMVVKRESLAEEKLEEPSQKISAMIKAFEERNSIIVDSLEELKEKKKEGKTYFDELRSRIDSFRSKALQRLNEARQTTVSQTILDLLNMVQNTEKEVERAVKDLINLYEQLHSNKVKKETFDKLLPNYRKRLERSLNALSDLLNELQRESKQA
jgi:F0F1-type ATP synthase membrane subunit b/b'